MVRSSFSGREIPPGKGIMYVKKDGKVFYFLNRKEEKNMLKLKRKPRATAWTEDYRKEKGQRIAIAQHAAEHAHGEEKQDAARSKTTKATPAKKAAKASKPKAGKKKPAAKKTPAKKSKPKKEAKK